ncbi:hypothetical protein HK098_001292 [Nowakowskiella sp. JEL0407]|nr:hypothetical protein HK098_001292 [Nowakowskiella sp. JEL0407]
MRKSHAVHAPRRRFRFTNSMALRKLGVLLLFANNISFLTFIIPVPFASAESLPPSANYNLPCENSNNTQCTDEYPFCISNFCHDLQPVGFVGCYRDVDCAGTKGIATKLRYCDTESRGSKNSYPFVCVATKEKGSFCKRDAECGNSLLCNGTGGTCSESANVLSLILIIGGMVLACLAFVGIFLYMNYRQRKYHVENPFELPPPYNTDNRQNSSTGSRATRPPSYVSRGNQSISRISDSHTDISSESGSFIIQHDPTTGALHARRRRGSGSTHEVWQIPTPAVAGVSNTADAVAASTSLNLQTNTETSTFTSFSLQSLISRRPLRPVLERGGSPEQMEPPQQQNTRRNVSNRMTNLNLEANAVISLVPSSDVRPETTNETVQPNDESTESNNNKDTFPVLTSPTSISTIPNRRTVTSTTRYARPPSLQLSLSSESSESDIDGELEAAALEISNMSQRSPGEVRSTDLPSSIPTSNVETEAENEGNQAESLNEGSSSSSISQTSHSQEVSPTMSDQITPTYPPTMLSNQSSSSSLISIRPNSNNTRFVTPPPGTSGNTRRYNSTNQSRRMNDPDDVIYWGY